MSLYVLVFVVGFTQSTQSVVVIPNLANYAECKRVESILKNEIKSLARLDSLHKTKYLTKGLCIEVLQP